MKKVISILILLSMLLGMTSAFASGDSSWIYTYRQFAEWINSSSEFAGLALDPEQFGEFAWPSEPTTLTASVGKTLNFSPHPSLGRGNWSVPSHITVNGVELVYGSTQGTLETAQLTIAGAWNGEVLAHQNFTLTGSVQGDVSISGDAAFDLAGEVDGNLTLSKAKAKVDLTKVKHLHIYEPCEISGNLKAESLSFGGYLGVEHTLTIQSGSIVEITGENGSHGSTEEMIIVESGATLTLYEDTYANITVKKGGILNLKMRDGGMFSLINAHLNIEEGGLVNAYRGISVHYSEYYGDKNGKITGSGTICFWKPQFEGQKYGYVYFNDATDEGEKEYLVNDGNVPRVDATVIFTTAVCEHERGENPWISYEGYHTYLCSKCGNEIDGGLHSYHSANVVVTTSGSIYTCKQCGYVKNSGVFWGIKKGVLSIQGVGDIPYISTKKAPWYEKRESIREIVIGEGVTSIETAFADCTNLTTVRIPSSMTYLSAQMFKGCSGLQRVELPAGLVNVGMGAFDGCAALTDVYFGGTEEEWNDVVKSGKNDALTNATVHFNTPMLSVTAEKTETQTTVRVIPSNLASGTALLLGCYQNGVLTDVQIKVYQGTEETFAVTEPYDSIKVMAWENTSDMKAVCTSVIR